MRTYKASILSTFAAMLMAQSAIAVTPDSATVSKEWAFQTSPEGCNFSQPPNNTGAGRLVVMIKGKTAYVRILWKELTKPAAVSLSAGESALATETKGIQANYLAELDTVDSAKLVSALLSGKGLQLTTPTGKLELTAAGVETLKQKLQACVEGKSK